MNTEDAILSPLENPFGMPSEEYYSKHKVVHESRHIDNSRGLRLFTQSWLPESGDPKALLFLCHGYGNDTSWLFQTNAVKFASHGFAVFSLDYEGHGQSDGVRCSILNFDLTVDDCLTFFLSKKNIPHLKGLKCFLYGESMGAMVVLHLLKRDPQAWHGAILASPMLKVSDSMRPHWMVATVLQALAYFMPNAALVPSKPLLSRSFRDPRKFEIALANPRRYTGNPRLGVALEILRVTNEVVSQFEDVDCPFLIIHGEEDSVTDPLASKEFFSVSKSVDKTLKLYPRAMHQLLAGEPDEDVKVIWKDVLDWLQERL